MSGEKRKTREEQINELVWLIETQAKINKKGIVFKIKRALGFPGTRLGEIGSKEKARKIRKLVENKSSMELAQEIKKQTKKMRETVLRIEKSRRKPTKPKKKTEKAYGRIEKPIPAIGKKKAAMPVAVKKIEKKPVAQALIKGIERKPVIGKTVVQKDRGNLIENVFKKRKIVTVKVIEKKKPVKAKKIVKKKPVKPKATKKKRPAKAKPAKKKPAKPKAAAKKKPVRRKSKIERTIKAVPKEVKEAIKESKRRKSKIERTIKEKGPGWYGERLRHQKAALKAWKKRRVRILSSLEKRGKKGELSRTEKTEKKLLRKEIKELTKAFEEAKVRLQLVEKRHAEEMKKSTAEKASQPPMNITIGKVEEAEITGSRAKQTMFYKKLLKRFEYDFFKRRITGTEYKKLQMKYRHKLHVLEVQKQIEKKHPKRKARKKTKQNGTGKQSIKINITGSLGAGGYAQPPGTKQHAKGSAGVTRTGKPAAGTVRTTAGTAAIERASARGRARASGVNGPVTGAVRAAGVTAHPVRAGRAVAGTGVSARTRKPDMVERQTRTSAEEETIVRATGPVTLGKAAKTGRASARQPEVVTVGTEAPPIRVVKTTAEPRAHRVATRQVGTVRKAVLPMREKKKQLPKEEPAMVKKAKEEKSPLEKNPRLRKAIAEKAKGVLGKEKISEVEGRIAKLINQQDIQESKLEAGIEGIAKGRLLEDFDRLIHLLEEGKEPEPFLPKVPETAFRKKKDKIKAVEKIIKKKRIETDFDKITALVQEAGKINAPKVRKKLGMDKKRFRDCCDILEENHLIQIQYPAIGKPRLLSPDYIKKKNEKKKKKKKEEVKKHG